MRAILPLAVLALLLIGAGLLLTVNSADPEVPLGPVTSSGPAVSGAERSEDVEQLEDVQHSAPTTARTTAQVQEELPLASSEDVERRATFTGRLLDPSGSPVVGALVELRNADFLDGVVFLQADRAATREAEEGWSDGSGAFELVTENRGEQALHFSADGYVQQRRLVRAVPGQVTALGDIELEELMTFVHEASSNIATLRCAHASPFKLEPRHTAPRTRRRRHSPTQQAARRRTRIST